VPPRLLLQLLVLLLLLLLEVPEPRPQHLLLLQCLGGSWCKREAAKLRLLCIRHR